MLKSEVGMAGSSVLHWQKQTLRLNKLLCDDRGESLLDTINNISCKSPELPVKHLPKVATKESVLELMVNKHQFKCAQIRVHKNLMLLASCSTNCWLCSRDFVQLNKYSYMSYVSR